MISSAQVLAVKRKQNGGRKKTEVEIEVNSNKESDEKEDESEEEEEESNESKDESKEESKEDAKEEEEDPNDFNSVAYAGPTYEENEINGKFKLQQRFDPKLNDVNSEEFKELSKNVEEGLMDILHKDNKLKRGADFNVEVIGFK